MKYLKAILRALIVVCLILILAALMGWADVYHPVGLLIVIVIVIFVLILSDLIRNGD